MWPNRSKLRIWLQLLKKYLMENVIFCAVLFGSDRTLKIAAIQHPRISFL